MRDLDGIFGDLVEAADEAERLTKNLEADEDFKIDGQDDVISAIDKIKTLTEEAISVVEEVKAKIG